MYLVVYNTSHGKLYRLRKTNPHLFIGQITNNEWEVLDVQTQYHGQFYTNSTLSSIFSKKIEKNIKIKKNLNLIKSILEKMSS